ncbi:hypothetical protein ACLOJK_021040 [Asimina triloba]
MLSQKMYKEDTSPVDLVSATAPLLTLSFDVICENQLLQAFQTFNTKSRKAACGVATSSKPLLNIEETTPAETLINPLKLNDQGNHQPSAEEHTIVYEQSSTVSRAKFTALIDHIRNLQ